MGGELSHFSERSNRRDLELEFWVGIGTLGWDDFFRWDLKTPYIKNSEYILKVVSATFCQFVF